MLKILLRQDWISMKKEYPATPVIHNYHIITDCRLSPTGLLNIRSQSSLTYLKMKQCSNLISKQNFIGYATPV